jgi:hypothetical protein
MWNNHHFAAHFVTISPKSSSKSSTSGLAKAFFNTYVFIIMPGIWSSASINSVSTLPVTAAVATSLKLSLPKPCDFAAVVSSNFIDVYYSKAP